MAGSVNKAILIGNLGRDPEIRRTQNGAAVANFSIACNETWKDKATGEKREEVTWVNVVVFNEALVKVAEQYLKKGSKVYVEGKIKVRKYQAKDGSDRTATEVVLNAFGSQLVMLDGRDGERAPAPDAESYGSHRRAPQAAAGQNEGHSTAQGSAPLSSLREDLADEIPF